MDNLIETQMFDYIREVFNLMDKELTLENRSKVIELTTKVRELYPIVIGDDKFYFTRKILMNHLRHELYFGYRLMPTELSDGYIDDILRHDHSIANCVELMFLRDNNIMDRFDGFWYDVYDEHKLLNELKELFAKEDITLEIFGQTRNFIVYGPIADHTKYPKDPRRWRDPKGGER